MKKPAALRGFLLLLAVACVGIALAIWLSGRGYGKVSRDAYEISKALYGSCLAKDERRLDAVVSLLDGNAESQFEISDQERKWLNAIADKAKNGDWQPAAKSARRMMEDQADL